MTELYLNIAAATKAPTQGAGTLDALGDLPEWNLSDLYDSIGSDTILRDLEGVTAGAESFANSYRGALSGLAKNDPDGLLTAVRSFEEIQDKLGRIGSFAGLSYASNTTDPEIAKFYGDMNEKLTAISSNLLFFELELNIIDDELIEAALTHSGLAHYRPWFEDLRLDKPYQLSEKIEELFHEKSITGRGAFNRLFDETMAGLR
ncbi:MAG: oligoendopeptidase F, partial [Hyphomicrobiales bacterium]